MTRTPAATLGVFSYRRLAIDVMPDVEIPVLTVITQFPGASPETVEREVTKRVEQAVNPIAGVERVCSRSRDGLSTVIVEFTLKADLVDESQREVAVDLDPSRLDALGLGVDEVVAGLAGENVNTPLGRLDRGGQEMPVRVSG